MLFVAIELAGREAGVCVGAGIQTRLDSGQRYRTDT
jgi:hypothetical protein